METQAFHLEKLLDACGEQASDESILAAQQAGDDSTVAMLRIQRALVVRSRQALGHSVRLRLSRVVHAEVCNRECEAGSTSLCSVGKRQRQY